MRKPIFVTAVMLVLFSICGMSQSFAGDLYVRNNTNQPLTSISFTATAVMETFTGIAPGNERTGAMAYLTSDVVTVSVFFANVPRGAVAKVYNSDMDNPDGTFPIQPGLNTFQLNGPLDSGGIVVIIEP